MANVKAVLATFLILATLTAIILFTTEIGMKPRAYWSMAIIRPLPLHRIHRPSDLESQSVREGGATSKQTIKSKTSKWILIYTTLFGGSWGEGVNEAQGNLSYLNCDVDYCRVTYNKELLAQSSAVVFHARDMPPVEFLRTLSSSQRPSWQRWAYHISESPINTPNVEPLDGLFNLTMTYELDSDIFMPYRKFRKFKPGEPKPREGINYAAEKTKMAAWLVSNCQVDFRNDFVRHLESHGVEVNVGGGCRSRWPHQLDCSGRTCTGLEQNRFFLALENGFCKDYITGKYWYPPFEYNMIPVVLGGADYNKPNLVIPGSYINIRDFKDVSALAAYLKLVASNETLFNSYFDWKQHYYIYPDTPADNWPHPANFLCELCRIAHDEHYPDKTYASLGTLRNVARDCQTGMKYADIWKKD